MSKVYFNTNTYSQAGQGSSRPNLRLMGTWMCTGVFVGVFDLLAGW